MTLALHQVVEKLPFIDTAQPVQPPRVELPIDGAEIGYTDVDKDGRPVPQVLEFFTPEAFESTKLAARAFGYSALALNMQDRQDHGFEPVESDEVRGDETAREEWAKGNYNPNVFHGQTALALRWLLKEAAENPTRPTLPNEGHILPPKLWSRMVVLNEKTTPVNDAKAQVHPRVVQMAEEVKAQGTDPTALVTGEGSVTLMKETGGHDYDAFRASDSEFHKQRAA